MKLSHIKIDWDIDNILKDAYTRNTVAWEIREVEKEWRLIFVKYLWFVSYFAKKFDYCTVSLFYSKQLYNQGDFIIPCKR